MYHASYCPSSQKQRGFMSDSTWASLPAKNHSHRRLSTKKTSPSPAGAACQRVSPLPLLTTTERCALPSILGRSPVRARASEVFPPRGSKHEKRVVRRAACAAHRSQLCWPLARAGASNRALGPAQRPQSQATQPRGDDGPRRRRGRAAMTGPARRAAPAPFSRLGSCCARRAPRALLSPRAAVPPPFAEPPTRRRATLDAAPNGAAGRASDQDGAKACRL
jgi:hypothetical protein